MLSLFSEAKHETTVKPEQQERKPHIRNKDIIDKLVLVKKVCFFILIGRKH
jgi:hypothetical protein